MLSIWGKYILGASSFSLKRYLYVIRPALAMLWLRQHGEGMPPMDMPALLASVSFPDRARADLADLLARKALASEIGNGPAIPSLHALVHEVLALDPEEDGGDPDDAVLARAEALYQATVWRSAW